MLACLGCLGRVTSRAKGSGITSVAEHEPTAESLWAEVAGRLKGALNTTTYRTWFAEASGADLSDDTFAISVPNGFTREGIEGHFLGLISAALRCATGPGRRIAL